MSATSNFPFVLNEVDIIPRSDSGEFQQNSEPSIAVNPVNLMQVFAGSFGSSLLGVNLSPFFLSEDAGATWSDFAFLPSQDKSIAWKVDGSAVLVATLVRPSSPVPPPMGPPPIAPEETGDINTWQVTGTDTGFDKINTLLGSNLDDQPWIRTGPSDHVYVAFNDLGAARDEGGNGGTASVIVSDDGGSSYFGVILDKVGAPAISTIGHGVVGQDAPTVRLAVNGNTVYAAFIRWTSLVDENDDGLRFNSPVVVVRSDNGGEDGFTKLGTGGNGVQAATPIDVASETGNNPLTLGQDRSGNDLSIAVDPNNSKHVLVVYNDAPGATRGQLQLVVSESTDGGETWAKRATSSSSTRSGQSGLAILANGAIGLLYNNYDPATDKLSQHLLTTTDDFATARDVTLATESNSIPAASGEPYLGDFFDLTGTGDTFYGIFSASNADNGFNALFTNTTFNRSFVGTPGTSDFRLIDTKGNPVPYSIDPFFFAYSILTSPPGVTANMVLGNTDNGEYEIYNLGNNNVLASDSLGQVGTDWEFVTLGAFNDGGTSDMLLRNSSSGAFQVYNIAPNNNITGSASLGAVGVEWQFSGIGNFGSGISDMLLRNSNTGGLQVYNISDNQITGSAFMGTVGVEWEFSGIGNFSSGGTSDDMLLRNSNTGGLQVYNISDNQITGSAFMGAVGVEWEFSGIGNFSSAPGESDLLLRNSNTGGLQVYNISDNQITGSAFMGAVGVEWQFAGVAPVLDANSSDLVLRNVNTGAFEVYNIADNQVTGSAPLGAVGLDWQLGGFAATSPSSWQPSGSAASSQTGSMGSSENSTAQIGQAMASFGGDSGAAPLTTAPLGADTSQQQPLLTIPQHA